MAKLKDTEINGNLAVDGDVIVNGHQVLDSANVGSYALPITGGTVSGNVKATNLEATNIINAVNFDGVFVEGLRFYDNTEVTLNCDSRGVVKVYLGYNGLPGYVDDIIWLNGGTIQQVVHNGTATNWLQYYYNDTNKLLTIQSPSAWSYGFAIGTRFFV